MLFPLPANYWQSDSQTVCMLLLLLFHNWQSESQTPPSLTVYMLLPQLPAPYWQSPVPTRGRQPEVRRRDRALNTWWNNRQSTDSYWHLMTFNGIFWQSSDIYWHLISVYKHFTDIHWHILTLKVKHFDNYLNILNSTDIYWHVLTTADIYWHLLTFTEI